MLSCFVEKPSNNRVLDFAAGTCWVTEFLNRCGYNVVAFDMDPGSGVALSLRAECDARLLRSGMHFTVGDGHQMPFADETFAHVCCFDSLHHMHDFPQVFREFYRILGKRGRIIFVEPGAKHSSSRETVEFMEKYKKDDPHWIERDVILEDVWQIGKDAGFHSMTVRPVLLPELCEYSIKDWLSFRNGSEALAQDYLTWLKSFNYDSRVVFFIELSSSSAFQLRRQQRSGGRICPTS